MFTITEGKGFCIKFDNGWEVSIQFGPFNYCQNRCSRFVDPSIIRRHDVSCDDAEIAVFTPCGKNDYRNLTKAKGGVRCYKLTNLTAAP